jgi:DNA-binding NtrC family response regulator
MSSDNATGQTTPPRGQAVGGDEAQTTVLVVDDERLVRWSLRTRLEQEGHHVLEAATGMEGWQHFEQGVDLVLLDYRLPDIEGIDLLRRMVAADADVPVILLTAYSSVNQAVETMKAGAHHYAGKPFDLDEVALIVERALRSSLIRRRVAALRAGGVQDLGSIVGESAAIGRTKALLAKIARSPSSTVLLTGESGTGKDLAASVIHQLSARREGPFLNITCTALATQLLESELFGHERGAFTDAKERKKGLLEQAHSGTVFLDEVGEMSLEMQSKLLRFLEQKTFRRVGGSVDIRADVRIVAATNAALRELVKKGQFREDLYYRLAVLTVELPPLRAREGDVARLVEYFTQRFSREFNKRVEGVNAATLERLSLYSWPGNVRELRNALERAVLLADSSVLSQADFPMLGAPAAQEAALDFVLPPTGVDFAALERTLVRQALQRSRGNRTLAATLLGMNRDQIRYRIEKFELTEHMHAEETHEGEGS